MKKRRFLVLLVFPTLLTAPISLASDVLTLSQRVAPDFAQQASRSADNTGQPLSVIASQYRDAIQADGSWLDIDYALVATNEKPVREHLDRIRVLAAAEHLSPILAMRKRRLRRCIIGIPLIERIKIGGGTRLANNFV